MEPAEHHISILQGIEKRAKVRPCVLNDLRQLERELEESVGAFRQERERCREREIIEAEPVELRKAMYAARAEIRSAMIEHEMARSEVCRLEEMVRRGHVHEALKEHAKLQTPAIFPDLNCDFVGIAVRKQRAREQWLVAAVMAAAAIVLMAVVVIELMKRATSNSP